MDKNLHLLPIRSALLIRRVPLANATAPRRNDHGAVAVLVLCRLSELLGCGALHGVVEVVGGPGLEFCFVFSVRLKLREATVLLDLVIALVDVPGSFFNITRNVVAHVR